MMRKHRDVLGSLSLWERDRLKIPPEAGVRVKALPYHHRAGHSALPLRLRNWAFWRSFSRFPLFANMLRVNGLQFAKPGNRGFRGF